MYVCSFVTALRRSIGVSPGLLYAVGITMKRAQLQNRGHRHFANGEEVKVGRLCVRNLTWHDCHSLMESLPLFDGGRKSCCIIIILNLASEKDPRFNSSSGSMDITAVSVPRVDCSGRPRNVPCSSSAKPIWDLMAASDTLLSSSERRSSLFTSAKMSSMSASTSSGGNISLVATLQAPTPALEVCTRITNGFNGQELQISTRELQLHLFS